MSDGAGVKCCTFCTILDRKYVLEFLSSHYSQKCELFDESMEISAIEFLFYWKQSRTAARPPCGLKTSLKVGNN